MPRAVEQAITYCASHLKTEPDGCQKECRVAYGVASDGTPSAAADWVRSQHKHRTDDPKAIPRGALVRWTGGSHGYGHVAIATGDGRCWSTDIITRGRRSLVDIDLIRQKWGLTLVGWTEDIDGVVVYASLAAKVETSGRPPKIQKAIDKLKTAKKDAADKPTQRRRITKALGWLRKIGGKK